MSLREVRRRQQRIWKRLAVGFVLAVIWLGWIGYASWESHKVERRTYHGIQK